MVRSDLPEGVTREVMDVDVLIVGGGAERAEWESLFNEVTGEVSFLGPITGVRLRSLYARSRLVVIPSLENEGMGMVAADALANGVPVCASEQPALREVVKGAGLYPPMGSSAKTRCRHRRSTG